MLIGAELTINARPGQGCVVLLRLPQEAAVKDFAAS
jgi:hypothetical protein